MLVLSAACAAGALLLTACGGGGSGESGDGTVTLKLVAADYGDKASNSSTVYREDVARRFEAADPDIKADVQVVNWNDIDAQVKTMLQSGNVPDVLQTGGYADKVADGLLHKAEEVLSPATRDNLVDTFAEADEVDGVQYGIPFVSSARALFYNKKLFADADGKYTLDSEANVETFQWLRANLVEPGLTYSNPAATDRKTAFADFAAGKVGMLNGHPSLIQMSKDGDVDHGVAPVPGKDGALDSTLGVADWVMAFKDRGHQEEIKKFLDFAYSKENTLKFDEMYNLMPVTEDTLREMTSSGRHKDLEPFFELLPKASFYPLGDTSWDAVSAEIKKSGGTAVEEDPAEVLGDLQKKAEQIAAGQ
ncbi:extracellular solute-binding protein [Streptomyces sp. MA15]|uniref:extracellular solute-binding protein n=1 Tax=Streptomyces sp. MA15 TaxID=3055061 RepID=UPI0025B02BC8|nr:extracellular solute-binding protein [Streptomyces sp. MA15]MDN3267243.1 extracellular solute-binding protein [Streptomyces sp. MA15]